MDDVLIVGAGPAGVVAGIVLARAGARVRIVDRATFPRDKLCGDTLNPGTLAMLDRLKIADGIERAALRVEGMLVTGEGGVVVEGRYPRNLRGLAISRREMDDVLVRQAIRAGVSFEPGVTVREAIVREQDGTRVVEGVMAASHGTTHALRARVVVAADGRRSTLAFDLGLARHCVSPRRWAIGVYVEEPGRTRPLGEMHLRRGRYIGVAPLPGGLVNICVVKPSGPGDPDLRSPEDTLRRELAADRMLGDRYAAARLVRAPIVLGPLAVDATGRSVDGLILAGDAAGFIDPMTGDGVRFAVRGGELAAAAALHALEHGWQGVHARLRAERRREFGRKWIFNRILRAMVASPASLHTAGRGARALPGLVRALVDYAGDCGLAVDQADSPLDVPRRAGACGPSEREAQVSASGGGAPRA